MPIEKKYFLTAIAAAGITLTVAFGYVVLPKLPVYGQNDSVVSEPKRFVVSTVNENTLQIAPEPTASPFAANDNRQVLLPDEIQARQLVVSRTAPLENTRMQYYLSWAFGGKSQRGWFLYVPLIKQIIGAEREADTPEFANSLAAWQQRFGLAPSGTLDDTTLYKIIEFWQARRLNRSDYPTPDRLLIAPPTDFYDPMRETELRQVDRETYAAYKRLVAAAIKDKTLNLRQTNSSELAPDEKFLKIVSAFRSREYQARLRRESPGSGRAGLATNSPHFTGRALDLYVGGEPVTTKDFNRAIQIQTPVYKWLVKNAERFGFFPYFYEPWHWEYIPEALRKPTAPVK